MKIFCLTCMFVTFVNVLHYTSKDFVMSIVRCVRIKYIINNKIYGRRIFLLNET